MSDEKLDLILAVVSDINLKLGGLNMKTDNRENESVAAKIDRLEKEIIYYRIESLEIKGEIRE